MSAYPHSADYPDPPSVRAIDWKIGLSELLRMIQLYNNTGGGYRVCSAGEDGFCPGL